MYRPFECLRRRWAEMAFNRNHKEDAEQ